MQISKSGLVKKTILAEKYLRDSKNLKAVNCLKEIVYKDPTSDQAWLLLGIANRRIGELDEAIECFKTATELNSSMEEAWGLLTITYIDQGNIDKAKETIEKAGQINPFDEKIQLYRENLVKIYVKHGPFF